MFSNEIVRGILGALGCDSTIVDIGHESLGRNMVLHLVDSNLILKIYKFTKRWQYEVASLKYLSEKSINTPVLLKYGIYDEAPWALMTFVGGVNIDIKTLCIEDRKEVYFNMGQFHARFAHECQTSTFGKWDENMTIENDMSYVSFIEKEILKKTKICCEFHYGNKKLFEAGVNFLLNRLSILEGNHDFTLVHLDFGFRNLLYKVKSGNYEIENLIDFEASYPCDAEIDIAKTLISIVDEQEAYYYLNGYMSVKQLSKNFKEKLTFYTAFFCFDICAWAYNVDRDYYNLAIERLNTIIGDYQ